MTIPSLTRMLQLLKSALAETPEPEPIKPDTVPSLIGRPRSSTRPVAARDRTYAAKRYRTANTRDLWVISRLSRLKRKAKELRVPFDLTAKDLRDLLAESDMRCAVLGTRVEFAHGKGCGTSSISLLRLDQSGAFTKSNMVICSTLAIRLFNFIDLPQAVEMGRFAAAVLSMTRRGRIG